MHALAGAHVAPQAEHVPSTIVVHDLYLALAGSNMHASRGLHGAPKWKQVPALALVQAK